MSIAPLTELQAINQMLAAVGQAPVTSIDTTDDLYKKNSDDTYTQLNIPTNPDVAMARLTLDEISRECQSEGWSFNREYEWVMTPDKTTKKISIPDNMLQCDLSEAPKHKSKYGNKNSIRRDGFLYDKTEHSYTWDEAVYCDVLWYFEWEDVPRPIQDYIINKASAVYALRVVGDKDLYTFLVARAAENKATALEYETQQGDYTFFGHPTGQNYYNSYQPFHTLRR